MIHSNSIDPPLITSVSKLPVVEYPGGAVWRANVQNFAVLNGLSMMLLTLKPGSVREPHWNVNANELGYVLSGKLKAGITATEGAHGIYELAAGNIVFVPRGFVHTFENVGDDDCQIILFFDHEDPKDIGISSAVSAVSPEALAKVFGTESGTFESLQTFESNAFIGSTE